MPGANPLASTATVTLEFAPALMLPVVGVIVNQDSDAGPALHVSIPPPLFVKVTVCEFPPLPGAVTKVSAVGLTKSSGGASPS